MEGVARKTGADATPESHSAPESSGCDVGKPALAGKNLPAYFQRVKQVFNRLLHRLHYLLLVCCISYYALRLGERTEWNKERLYRHLTAGQLEKARVAAADLSALNGQRQLVRALQSELEPVRELAARALQDLWFNAAGVEAYVLMQTAHAAAERENYAESLSILDGLVKKYPAYAEGWNRRAAVYWQMGEAEKSQADCERVLALNPEHFGAWQGLAVCHWKLGDLDQACRSTRIALKIVPHDAKTRQFLRDCETLRRALRPAPRDQRPPDSA